MSEKIYRVQMNSSGMPNFSTAEEIDTEISEYSDKLWKNAYERGKEEEHRWWSEHCAKCTDADRPHGEWIRTGRTNIYGGIEVQCSNCNDKVMVQHLEDEWYCRHCGADMGMKGRSDE